MNHPPENLSNIHRLKKKFISVIGKENYIKYVVFLTDLYHATRVKYKSPGDHIIKKYLIPTGGTVMDIGANIGQFTTFVAPVVGKNGTIFSFEPVKAALNVLKKTVQLMGIHQAVVVEAALSEQNGTATITIPLKYGWKPQLGLSYLGNAPSGDVQKEEIRVQRLDDFCISRNIQHIDFIKCDTEGHEFFVFSGGKNVLSAFKPSIYCEVEAPYYERHHKDVNALFELLESLGYKSFLCNAMGFLKPVTGYETRSNYFFIHEEKMKHELANILGKIVSI